jgi:DNA-binding transcriptional MerR regulator
MTEFPWEEAEAQFPWEETGAEERESGGAAENGADAGDEGDVDRTQAPIRDAAEEPALPFADEPAHAAAEAAPAAEAEEIPDPVPAAAADAKAVAEPRAASRQLVRKEYYSISEVSELVGLPAHVLRYWESQFAVLNPSKNRSGNRVYQRKEIKLILLVKQLLHEDKYTVEGAKQKLDQLRRGGAVAEASAQAMDNQMIGVLREELLALSELLQVDSR